MSVWSKVYELITYLYYVPKCAMFYRILVLINLSGYNEFVFYFALGLDVLGFVIGYL